MNRKRIIIIFIVLALLSVGAYTLFNRSKAEGEVVDPYTNTKTAEWTDVTKQHADITITYYSQPKKVLWLGTLCNGHGLNMGSYTITAMNTILQKSAIDYAFFGTPTESDSVSGRTGSVGRGTTYTAISSYNYQTNYKGYSYTSYVNFDDVYSTSGKRIYLIPNQKASGTKAIGSTMGSGVTTLDQLKNNSTGTGHNSTMTDYLHLWSGYAKSKTNIIFPSGNTTLLEESGAGSITTLHFTNGFIWGEGAHANATRFAQEIVNRVSNKEYDIIVLSFDGLFEMANLQMITDAQVQTMHDAAELLKPYYEQGKVIWLTGTSVTSTGGRSYLEFLDDSSYTMDLTGTALTSFRNRFKIANAKYTASSTGYSSYTYLTQTPIKYNYMRSANEDRSNLPLDTRLPRFYYTRNMYQTMALFDPVKYLASTNSDGSPKSYPAISAWDLGNSNGQSVRYNNANTIATAYDNTTYYDRAVITDTVEDGLVPTSVSVYYYNSSTSSYVAWPSSDMTTTINGQNVSVTINKSSSITTPLKVVIHCTCPGEFDNNKAAKDTNATDAVLNTYKKNTSGNYILHATETYTSPQLLKLYSVTTSVTNGTITPTDTQISGGDTKTISYSPDTNYRLASVTVDGTPQDISSCTGSNPATICSSYTFDDYPNDNTFSGLSQDHTISVTYDRILADIKIKKEVKGTAAKLDEYFPYSITLSDTTNAYNITGLDATVSYDGNTITQPTATNNGTATIYLKDGQTATIVGVPTEVTARVEEISTNGYTVQVKYCDQTTCKTTANYPKSTYNMAIVNNYAVLDTLVYGNDANEITFTNTKDKPTVTGLIIYNAPYIVLILFALGAIALFGIGRNYLKKYQE